MCRYANFQGKPITLSHISIKKCNHNCDYHYDRGAPKRAAYLVFAFSLFQDEPCGSCLMYYIDCGTKSFFYPLANYVAAHSSQRNTARHHATSIEHPILCNHGNIRY